MPAYHERPSALIAEMERSITPAKRKQAAEVQAQLAKHGIAPTLERLARFDGAAWSAADERNALSEFRDLRAVYRAAREMARLTRASVDKGDQVCLTEVHLMLAVERAERRVGRRRTP